MHNNAFRPRQTAQLNELKQSKTVTESNRGTTTTETYYPLQRKQTNNKIKENEDKENLRNSGQAKSIQKQVFSNQNAPSEPQSKLALPLQDVTRQEGEKANTGRTFQLRRKSFAARELRQDKHEKLGFETPDVKQTAKFDNVSTEEPASVQKALNISSAQIEQFLECAGLRWLTGNEYANLLSHPDTLGPLLNVQTVEGNQHPRSIYFKPKNGMLYYLRNVADVKKLGFPPLLQECPNSDKSGKSNSKYVCWKRMNFVTRIPKGKPKVEYIVASGRSSKLRTGSESGTESGSSAPIYFRMHIVWLFSPPNIKRELDMPANEPPGQLVLCHVLQITSDFQSHCSLLEEDQRSFTQQFEFRARKAHPRDISQRTAGVPGRRKQFQTTASPLAKRRPLGATRRELETAGPVAEQRVETTAKCHELDPESPSRKQSAASPILFKWRSNLKRTEYNQSSARPVHNLGLSSESLLFKSSLHKKMGFGHSPTRFEEREVRRVLFDAKSEIAETKSVFASSKKERLAKEEEDLPVASGIRLAECREDGCPPPSEYKLLLRFDEQPELGTVPLQTWSPSPHSRLYAGIDSNFHKSSVLRSISKDSNQLETANNWDRMWAEQGYQLPANQTGRAAVSRYGGNFQSLAPMDVAKRGIGMQGVGQLAEPRAAPDRRSVPPAVRMDTLDNRVQRAEPKSFSQSRVLPQLAADSREPRIVSESVLLQAREQLLHKLSVYGDIQLWKDDPVVASLLGSHPVLMLRLDLELQHISNYTDFSPQQHRHWCRVIANRLLDARFTDFLRSAASAELEEVYLPEELLDRNRSVPTEESSLGFEQSSWLSRGKSLSGISPAQQTHNRCTAEVQVTGAWGSNSRTPESEDGCGAKREHEYSKSVRVRFAQRILALRKDLKRE